MGSGRGGAALALVGGVLVGALVFVFVVARLRVPEAREVLTILRG